MFLFSFKKTYSVLKRQDKINNQSYSQTCITKYLLSPRPNSYTLKYFLALNILTRHSKWVNQKKIHLFGGTNIKLILKYLNIKPIVKKVIVISYSLVGCVLSISSRKNKMSSLLFANNSTKKIEQCIWKQIRDTIYWIIP